VRNNKLVIALTASMLPAMLVTALPAAAQNTFDWNGRLASGRTIEIRGLNGGIELVRASGAEARVHATKTGRRTDPATVSVEVVENDAGIVVCAIYPVAEGQANRCESGSTARNVQDNDVTVEFRVEVPAGVRVVANTLNGSVSAVGLASDVDARTLNGSVRVETTGMAEARTINGSVDVVLGRVDWQGTLTYSTTNGTVSVTLPPSANVAVRASTVTGSIETDFPLTVSGRFGARSIEGTIGSGGRTLELRTTNGDIELRRR
jgi:hypothetical protein